MNSTHTHTLYCVVLCCVVLYQTRLDYITRREELSPDCLRGNERMREERKGVKGFREGKRTHIHSHTHTHTH